MLPANYIATQPPHHLDTVFLDAILNGIADHAWSLMGPVCNVLCAASVRLPERTLTERVARAAWAFPEGEMIDTVDFYRGAAVLLLLRTPGCVEVRAAEEGFVVNRSAYFELKHCTSGNSRWSFQVSSRDVERMTHHSKQACSVFLGLVCGSDGVCTLALLKDAEISGIIVEHRDRLAHFGSEYIEAALNATGRKLVIIESMEIKDDLVQDMMDVMTSFCAKFYGRGSAKNRAKRALEAAAK